jgi:hypothetical protein
MSAPLQPVSRRLLRKTVFLSASVPTAQRGERYRRASGAHFEIEQAVVSLARAVFSESGRLVFGGHPAISPLVAMVAGEYREPRHAEAHGDRPPAPITIFQSRAFQGFLPDETLVMYQLGYASITWIDAVDNERFSPKKHYSADGPCPKSLRAMRIAMITGTQPDAMVCIGGMEGVERERSLFHELRAGAPVYVLGSTGGAAALIAQEHLDWVRVIDREVMGRTAAMRRELSRATYEEKAPSERPETPVVPYPLIMQTIVDHLAGRDEGGS